MNYGKKIDLSRFIIIFASSIKSNYKIDWRKKLILKN